MSKYFFMTICMVIFVISINKKSEIVRVINLIEKYKTRTYEPVQYINQIWCLTSFLSVIDVRIQ